MEDLKTTVASDSYDIIIFKYDRKYIHKRGATWRIRVSMKK